MCRVKFRRALDTRPEFKFRTTAPRIPPRAGQSPTEDRNSAKHAAAGATLIVHRSQKIRARESRPPPTCSSCGRGQPIQPRLHSASREPQTFLPCCESFPSSGEDRSVAPSELGGASILRHERMPSGTTRRIDPFVQLACRPLWDDWRGGAGRREVSAELRQLPTSENLSGRIARAIAAAKRPLRSRPRDQG